MLLFYLNFALGGYIIYQDFNLDLQEYFIASGIIYYYLLYWHINDKKRAIWSIKLTLIL